jgi:hypothetical protein
MPFIPAHGYSHLPENFELVGPVRILRIHTVSHLFLTPGGFYRPVFLIGADAGLDNGFFLFFIGILN